MSAEAVEIDYTNWRGERSVRRIIPLAMGFTHNQWHTKDQWLLTAMDVEKKEARTFAMANIRSWKPVE